MSADLMKSKFVRRPSVHLWHRLSLKLLHRFLSNFSFGFRWAICPDFLSCLERKQEAHGPWCLLEFNQLGHWRKFQKLHICSLSTGGSKLSLFSLYGQLFWGYRAFFKLPYLGMKLGHWPKLQKLHIYSLSIQGGRNWAYFCSTGTGFQNTGQFYNLPYLDMKLGKWPKFQKLYVYNLSYSRVPNFTPFCSTTARFPDNWGFWFRHVKKQ